MDNFGFDAHTPEPERSNHESATQGTVLPQARAKVLADLQASGLATPHNVSILEDVVEQRRWWVTQWPEGSVYVAGLVAQDLQDALFDSVGRWPVCRACPDIGEHSLYVSPELGGPAPVWVCEESAQEMAELGRLAPQMD